MSIDLLALTEDETRDLFALSSACRTFSDLFTGREGTPETLRMTAAQLRTAADVLDAARIRWEQAIADH